MMKLLKLLPLSLLSILLLVPLLVVESSSSSNITRGSTLSSASDNDDTSHWLSPSGNLAFGFYRLPCTSCSPNSIDRYVVGIWFVKSSKQTLVWTANPNDLPLRKPSSILFNDQGKMMLRIMPDNVEKPLLPDVSEPASYAKMNDDGNFILYGSDSQIIWQSFDHPSNTLLGGQRLKPGISLIRGNYRLWVRTDGLTGIYRNVAYYYGFFVRDWYASQDLSIMSYRHEDPGSMSMPIFLSLSNAGTLFLASSEDEVVKVFYDDNKRKQQVNKEEGDYMYRATLSSSGRLNLHEERVDGNDNRINTIVWSSSPKTVTNWDDIRLRDVRRKQAVLIVLACAAATVILMMVCICCRKCAKGQPAGGDIELQQNNHH